MGALGVWAFSYGQGTPVGRHVRRTEAGPSPISRGKPVADLSHITHFTLHTTLYTLHTAHFTLRTTHYFIVYYTLHSPIVRGESFFIDLVSSSQSRGGPIYQEAGSQGTSLMRNIPPVGPYSSPMPRALWWS